MYIYLLRRCDSSIGIRKATRHHEFNNNEIGFCLVLGIVCHSIYGTSIRSTVHIILLELPVTFYLDESGSGFDRIWIRIRIRIRIRSVLRGRIRIRIRSKSVRIRNTARNTLRRGIRRTNFMWIHTYRSRYAINTDPGSQHSFLGTFIKSLLKGTEYNALFHIDSG